MINADHQIRDQVRSFVTQHFAAARARTLLDDDSLLGSHIVNSMGVLDLVLFVEKEFNIKIHEEELLSDNFRSIASIADFIRLKQEDHRADGR